MHPPLTDEMPALRLRLVTLLQRPPVAVITILVAFMILRHLKPFLYISPLKQLIFRKEHSATDRQGRPNNYANQLAGITTINKMSEYLTVSYVTVPNEEVGRELGRRLVERRLAACVNLVKTIESIYEWKGKIEHDTEAMLIIKSHSSKSKDLTEFVEKNHLYTCPEVINIKVDSGSLKYLDWVYESISKTPIRTRDDEEDKP